MLLPDATGARRALAVTLVCAVLAGGCGLSLAGCGSGGSPGIPPSPKVEACSTGGAPPIVVSGTVRYTRLVYSPPGGVGPAQETRPARFVDIDVQAAGVCFGRGSTDASGNYSITVLPPEGGGTLQVVAFSRTLENGARDIIVHEAEPPFVNAHSELDAFRYTGGSVPSTSNSTLDFTVPYDTGPSNRPGIGFGLLDTVVTCWDGVTGVLGGVLPRAHIYCRLGNNAALNDVSFFAPATQSIAMLGGSAGNPDTSDSDYFDDAIVAHEFGHFVERSISHSMTRGGFHGGQVLEPAFSWSEGVATGLGCLLIQDSNYVDSTGTTGAAQFAFDIENVTSFDPPGIGGEFTVAEICWDLSDGSGSLPDSDGDGVSLPLGDLLRAFDGFNAATDAPYLGLFLDRLVTAPGSSIDAPTMAALLSGPPTEDQGVSYPLTGGDVWPTQIGLGGAGSGTLDSLPGGPLKSPCRGIEASDWYQLTLAAPAVVTIHVDITPLAGGGNDLDLFLHHNANVDVQNPLASSSSSSGTTETINVSLNAGTYIIIVEAFCGGGGSRAAYNLTVN